MCKEHTVKQLPFEFLDSLPLLGFNFSRILLQGYSLSASVIAHLLNALEPNGTLHLMDLDYQGLRSIHLNDLSSRGLCTCYSHSYSVLISSCVAGFNDASVYVLYAATLKSIKTTETWGKTGHALCDLISFSKSRCVVKSEPIGPDKKTVQWTRDLFASDNDDGEDGHDSERLAHLNVMMIMNQDGNSDSAHDELFARLVWWASEFYDMPYFSCDL